MSTSQDTASTLSADPTMGIPQHFRNLSWGDPDREGSRPGTFLEKVLSNVSSVIKSVCSRAMLSSANAASEVEAPVATNLMIDTARQVMRKIMESANQSVLEDSIAKGIDSMPPDEWNQTMAEFHQSLVFLDSIYGKTAQTFRGRPRIKHVVFWHNAHRNAELSKENDRLKKELESTRANAEITKTRVVESFI